MTVLSYAVHDRVATVTLDRPESRNALNSELIAALAESMQRADADEAVDVVVLTGSDPAFCAGLDLKELGSTAANFTTAGPKSSPWHRTAVPVIGAVNGAAVTGGLEVALNCDFLIASDRAKFGDTHARVGVMPSWGLSVLLPQRIGLPRAIEMSLTGNFVGADEALALGLVNHVVPHGELLAAAQALAADIVGNDRATTRRLLRSYRQIADSAPTGAEALRLEYEAAREWRAEFDPSEVAARRDRIMERGRGQ